MKENKSSNHYPWEDENERIFECENTGRIYVGGIYEKGWNMD
jgi:hypothetical protein